MHFSKRTKSCGSLMILALSLVANGSQAASQPTLEKQYRPASAGATFQRESSAPAAPPPGKAWQRTKPTDVWIPTGRQCDITATPPGGMQCQGNELKHRAARIVYEFNDALYAAVLSWIPEKEFTPQADGRPVLPVDREARIFSVEKLADGLAARRQASVDKAAQARVEAKMRAEAEVSARKKAEAERIMALQEEAEQERQRFAGLKQSLISSSGISPAQALVWLDSGPLPTNRYLEEEPVNCFGWINYFVRNSSDSAVLFASPPGTSDAAQAKFNRTLIDQLGAPMVRAAVYDATADEWTVRVAASRCTYEIAVRVKGPGTDKVKADLLKLRPGVVFQLNGDTLTARTVQLIGPAGAAYTIQTTAPAPAKFSAASYASFKQQADRARIKAEQSAIDARNADQAKLGSSFWGQLVLAIDDSRHHCRTMKTVLMDYQKTGIPEAELNRIARGMIQDLKGQGCLRR